MKIQPRVFIFALVLQFATLAVFAQYSKLLDFPGGTEARDPIGVLITDGIYMYGITFHGGSSDMGTIYKIKQDGTGYVKIHDFTGLNGKNPEGSLYYDGTFLYGMTYLGGTNDMGVMYKIMSDGSNFQKLLDFDGTNGKGPYGTFVSDGNYLYGMTWQGGANDLGKIFKILPNGTGYQSLLDFAGASNGSLPAATLYYDGNKLYGMTSSGGMNGVGTVFGINTNGAGYTKLHDFAAGTNGREPYGALISDGTYLYGLTYFGGTSDLGTAFRIMPDGTNFSKLMDFTGISTGSHPYTTLTLAGSYLYGLAPEGGGSNLGTLFKIKPDGTGLTRLLNFVGASNGSAPNGTLLSIGPYLYGTTSVGGTSGNGTLFKYEITEPFTKLLDFTGPANGLVPFGSLYSDGIFLYGMTAEGGANDLGTIFKVKPDGTSYTKLLDFAGTSNGSGPNGSLISDGTFLYGMTSVGGSLNGGTIFKIMPDGTGYAKLYEFSTVIALGTGAFPQGDLFYDGTWLYGMTPFGGANNRGTFFKIKPDGSGYAKLSDFGAPFDGNQPGSSLYYDGTFFYGTTNRGGSANLGTIFKIKPDGTSLTKLLDFGVGTNGRYPEGSFTSDGTFLYGTTEEGGANNYGSLFKIKPDGSGFQTILSFDNNVYGSAPQGTPLLVGEFLYALAFVGGPNYEGTVFKIKTDGTNFTAVHEFSSIASGSNPVGGSLITDGTYFYGMTTNGGLNEGTVFRFRDIPENSTILNFTGIATGENPTYTRLTCDGASLYGMTSRGGTNDEGVVFKVNQDGSSFNKLYDFGPAPDGERPHGSLYNDGTFLYGMTSSGGSSFLNNDGTIFKIKPDGTGYLKIFDFNGTATGTDPSGALISDGVFLYGVTIRGGLSNSGTIFKILPDGSGFVKLHDFPATNGCFGDLTLIGATLYGMTVEGGADDEGAIFKIETNGTGYTTIHDFNFLDGSFPYSGALVYDGTYLYGMTELGGTFSDGTVFKIKPDGTGFQNLHNFSLPSGTIPLGALELVGSTLYGLTYQGGTADLGTLFKINTDGSGYQTLMDFDGIANGYEVLGTLCYCNNALYGVTTSGGTYDLGTIFKYVFPAAVPSVLPTITGFSPASGPIGTMVAITGTNFDITPSNNIVQFNGTTAIVTASDATSISTTVPIGAITGVISVTVGSNTASSSTNFVVCPAPPLTLSGQGCEGTAIILSASGGVNGQYRWYTVATGGTAIGGEVNSTYTTPVLSATTTYYVAINNGSCESARTPVVATINASPAKPTITSSITPSGGNVSVCSDNILTLSVPTGFSTYTWSPSGNSQQITASTSSNYSVVVTSAAGCSSVTSDILTVTVIPAPCSNQAPVIVTASMTTQIEGKVSLDLVSLISDPDNNVDIQSLKIKVPPTSGAKASINGSGLLELDYQGLSFAGTDVITIEVCDLFGDCTQQEIKIEVIGDLNIYNAISPNGDGLNDFWIIQYIDVIAETKENKVSVYNRWGDVVFETENYDNKDRVFKGLNKGGNELPSGTYFYKIEFASGRKTLTGYLAVKK